MKRAFSFVLVIVCIAFQTLAKNPLSQQMRAATTTFLQTLSAEQKAVANLSFDSEWRFDWNYTPRERKGLSMKNMTQPQRKAAMALVKLALSDKGIERTEAIMGLEYVLRQVENLTDHDLRRDPDNYAFAVFGTPDPKKPWAWSIEGHHLSLHFTLVDGKVEFMPSFFGSNPAVVLPGYIQEGKQVLKEEAEAAFQLLNSFDKQQLQKVVVSEKAPADMLTTNSRKAVLEKREGLALRDMKPAQQEMFKALLNVYLNRYHVTLKNQALDKISKADLNEICFVWMGNLDPTIGVGRGHYYRIQGPTFLIEYDNTQNNGNHVHSVVRDLTNDWGEDLLKMHYEAAHEK